MLKNSILQFLSQITLIVLLTGCVYEFEEKEIMEMDNSADLNISEDFSFNMATEISIEVNQGEGTYLLTYGDGQYLIGKYVTKKGKIAVNLPGHLDEIQLTHTSNAGQTKTYTLDVANQSSFELDLSSNQSSSAAASRVEDCNELLYAVNSQGGFYSLNVESGNYDALDLGGLDGGGSIACAVDKQNGWVYYNINQTLKYYDYNTNTHHVAHQGNPFNGSYPRMEHNPVTGNLYIAKNEEMFIIDPRTNAVLNRFDIVGLAAPVGGGDLAISKEGTIYMCCFSGLYRVEIQGEVAIATRISAENLPFQPTSMAIDRNDRLYLATNDANSQLIEMDKFDGAWAVVKTYPHAINDLGSFKCELADLSQQDSDNDGVIDAQDDYPNDPNAAATVYSPSDIGWGSLAYEDLWPSRGDYDFNDLVVNYRFIQVENAANQVVRLVGKFKIKAIGASLHNGFAFKLPIDQSLVSSVTGNNLTRNIVSLNDKGLEMGHSDGAVIMVFDDAFDNVSGASAGWFINTQNEAPLATGNEIEVVIEFTEPIDQSLIGLPPFNPFIFIGGDRGREVHLPDFAPTELADDTFFNTFHDNSDLALAKYYREINNMPWALNIIHDFRQPLEKTRIDEAYTKFRNWGESKGTIYKDWYTDISGYRNTNKMYNK
ncbi:MAG: LruC domain-containing protein [Cyclobacteriaceae bacterium]